MKEDNNEDYVDVCVFSEKDIERLDDLPKSELIEIIKTTNTQLILIAQLIKVTKEIIETAKKIVRILEKMCGISLVTNLILGIIIFVLLK